MRHDSDCKRVWLVVVSGLFVGCGGIGADDLVGHTARIQQPCPGSGQGSSERFDSKHSRVDVGATPGLRAPAGQHVRSDRPRVAGSWDALPVVEFRRRQVLQSCGGGQMTVPVSEQDHDRLARSFTLELWFRLDSTADQPLVRAGALALELKNERVQARLADRAATSYNIVADEWYHAAVVADRGQLVLWINGSPVGRVDLDGQHGWPRQDVVLGGTGSSGQQFCGRLDNPRLTPEALYSESFIPEQRLQVLDSMVFGFSFDDTLVSEGQVKDQGYRASHGRLEGDARLVAGAI